MFGGHGGEPTTVPTLSAGGFEAGVGAFDDHAVFHLGKGCHDMEEEFAACGCGVQSFREGTEYDASFAEVVDGVDDVADGSSEPVEFQTTRTSPSFSHRQLRHSVSCGRCVLEPDS